MFGQYHCKADDPSISEHIDIQPLHHKLYGIFFLKLYNAVLLLPKKAFFHCFLTQNHVFAIKMANHHDKQITPSKSWDQDGFFSLGLGYYQIQIMSLKILQHCGTQIRANT